MYKKQEICFRDESQNQSAKGRRQTLLNLAGSIMADFVDTYSMKFGAK
jgi:hypothetical protein